MLTLLGTIIALMFTASISNRSSDARIEALRQEMRALNAELRLEFHHEIGVVSEKIDRLTGRMGRLEERVGLVRS
jgi:ubiquinone biosynthesis protein UbiJ